ncbi:MAG TPA: hypothetical protein VGR65_10975 [Casimicrobiaceae bacterium]|nr:hypothetical protein [Casimicrobiaceae bacterium]
MADLINIGMLCVLCLYLRYRFAVPLAWAWLAFLAIPEVQIQLTSSYIDVPLNAAVTLALLVVLRMLVEPTADQRADIAIALLMLGIAAGSKYQMVPIALLTWAAIVLLAMRNPSSVKLKGRSIAFLVLSLAGMVVVLPKLLLNAVTFGNPFYPIAVAFGPIRLSGPEAMMQLTSISDAWLSWPGPVRWLASVFEFDAFRGRPLPWTLGQADVLQSSPSFRMGGYFGAYVLGAISLVVWSVWSTRAARYPAAMLTLISVLCAFLPLSHELRYYMFWMLMLVSITLVLVHSPLFVSLEQVNQRRFAHALFAIAATSVILMTGGVYLRPDGPTLQDLLRETESTIARLPDGATLCILNQDRRSFLYSSVFHPSHNYRTHLLWGDEADPECTVRLDLSR